MNEARRRNVLLGLHLLELLEKVFGRIAGVVLNSPVILRPFVVESRIDGTVLPLTTFVFFFVIGTH
ncbi:hypothetical protein BG842_04195 [Haladaptatus sp. W1]|nr:hypothetical protein BG842_04195 [Haladaptatus sp. W1]